MKSTPGTIASDVERLYGNLGVTALRRSLVSPSIHAIVLIRLGHRCRRRLSAIFRLLALATYGVDVHRETLIGPGLSLPHPTSIVIGRGSTIGRNAEIHQCVTIGMKDGASPTIGDDVLIYPGSVIIGPIMIGDGAIIGANSFVDKDVRPGEVVRGKV